MHTVYVPADRVQSEMAGWWGGEALAAVEEHAPDAARMADVLITDPVVVAAVWPRVLAKLERQPIEDLRVDVEDGYRGGPDAEDADVVAAARAVAADVLAGVAPPFLGVRAKCLEAPGARPAACGRSTCSSARWSTRRAVRAGWTGPSCGSRCPRSRRSRRSRR